MKEYAELKKRLAAGWNTWNYRSVLSHVLLPDGLAVNLGLKEYRFGEHLREALIGRQGKEDEVVLPGPRSYDGSYTQLDVQWKGVEFSVETGADGGDLLALVTLKKSDQLLPPRLVVEAGVLWGRPGCAARVGDRLEWRGTGRGTSLFSTAPDEPEPYVTAIGPYLAPRLTDKIGLSTGRRRGVGDIEAFLARRRAEREAHAERFGELAELYAAMQTPLAWDTVYDPQKDRVVSPVSRLWCCWHGGYTLYDWDTYFAACLASLDNKPLAYANAVEITHEATAEGFVPNGCNATGFKSLDRSEPPVGAMTVLLLYRRFGDRWLVEMLFEPLLAWNRWWHARRRGPDGLLAWGSTPYQPVTGNPWEGFGMDDRWGASMESGMDNSPMYDDIPFDKGRHILKLADAGLNGLYLADCRALEALARAIGRADAAAELAGRADEYAKGIQRLWDEQRGLFLNRRTDTGEFSRRISPTCFYPLLGGAATQAQARRAAEHLSDPAELGGQWVIPSIARSDPAYREQNYWRGRVWAPLNFLTYLSLRQYDLPAERRELARKSAALLLNEWRRSRHVHENYNAETGEGCDQPTSDRFYHWGGLLGLISFFEAGWFDRPFGD